MDSLTFWAIMPERLPEIRARLQAEIDNEPAAGPMMGRTAYNAGNTVKVLPMFGEITPRGGFWGGVSVADFTQSFRAAVADPDISAIVLEVDSPGGQVGGVNELAAEIYRARGSKPIIAVANGLAASAAYWLASAADELVVTPSGEVGSIGVFAVHTDYSAALDDAGIVVTMISAGRYKTEGNPFEPLSDEARAAAQGRVDDYYRMFTAAVAKHRNATPNAVAGGFGEGRVVSAEQAVALGMADRVATIDEVIGGIKAAGPLGRNRADTDYRLRRLRQYGY